MGRPVAKWRTDAEFVALVKRVWPQDLRESDPSNTGYTQSTRNKAYTKLRHRWEGFRAAMAAVNPAHFDKAVS